MNNAPGNEWNRVVELFESAAAMPEADRLNWVRAQCGDDDALYEEVRSLLDAAKAETIASAQAPDLRALEGRRYGPWETVRILGTGGMGTVLLVKRVEGEFEQTAALKLVAPHLAGPYFLERFRAERQIQAQLNHPNITKLLDGGVAEDTGVPYFVMEYVDGLPLDQFADARKLSVRARLRLFLTICDAVEFAHRNLVVHRDLKPGNILVETASGEPKLLDFGTAKMLPGAGDTEATTKLHRLVTPRYASPEALRHAPMTTQADVFSLGVLLYEQLTGVWPFGDVSTPADVLDRIKSGLMTPPDSSITRQVADNRSTSIRDLRGVARGDLAKILRKATRNELNARYKSVEEFSSDLRSYLDGMPVSARNPTAWYRAGKFLKRNWLPSGAVAGLGIGLAGAAFYSYGQAEAARREADRSFLATYTLRTIIEAGSASSEYRDVKLSEIVKRVEAQMDRADPAIVPTLLLSLAGISFSSGKSPEAISLAGRAIARARENGDHFTETAAHALLSTILVNFGRLAEGRTEARLALGMSGNADSRADRANRFVANWTLVYGAVYGLGPEADTDERIDEAIQLCNSDPLLASGLVQLYTLLASRRSQLKDEAGEVAALEKGLAILRKQSATGALNSANSLLILDHWRSHLDRKGDFDGALRFARERLDRTRELVPNGHYLILHPYTLWARQLARKKDWDGASRELALCREEFVKAETGKLAVEWLLFASSAWVENRRGNALDAERYARVARINKWGWDEEKDARVAESRLELGIALRQQKRFPEAIQEIALSQKIYLAAWGPGHVRTKMIAAELDRAQAGDSGIPR